MENLKLALYLNNEVLLQKINELSDDKEKIELLMQQIVLLTEEKELLQEAIIQLSEQLDVINRTVVT